ncbi:hypothetical protein A2773_04050 [Candidatus Gottesmanbacteria bacterium RIFCSPHIGHO2_01_FULL_39_10]|uniref:Transporter n=1 Tax=Candidatus Gottesmanbacteria bacterium RIFCSPHIGHO2_01_FULL_39_10 TaxID=1798375 RepID=A0A1F5ZQM3_9BACT|nr:MAG: hypothetical protein A2773_04050 [Candidatus Gottesmanbacteria bacterium RIFCSPHIGHO2_01_FULL_39_10]
MVQPRHKIRKPLRFQIVLSAILFWALLSLYIYMISPNSILAFMGFYMLVFLGLYFTFNILLARGRSLIWTLIILIFLFLRQMQFINIVTVILLLGIFVTMELMLRKK